MTLAVETSVPGGGLPLLDDRLFTGFFTLVSVLVVLGLGVSAWLLVRAVRVLRRGGPVGQGRRVPLARRLDELDELHRRGAISDEEHALARHRALTSG